MEVAVTEDQSAESDSDPMIMRVIMVVMMVVVVKAFYCYSHYYMRSANILLLLRL